MIMRVWMTAVAAGFIGSVSALAQAPISTRSFPLNNTSGVPFHRSQAPPGYQLDGFEVDAQGNVYFLARKQEAGPSWLTAYGTTTRRYSRELPATAGRLTFNPAGQLLTLARDETRLYTLRPADGSVAGQQLIQHRKPGPADFRNANMLFPQGLFFEYVRNGAGGSSTYSYQHYALDGRYVATTPTLYQLPEKLRPVAEAVQSSGGTYVGAYNGSYYFLHVVFDELDQLDGLEVSRYTADGRKSTFRIAQKQLGLPLYGEYEFDKIRNGKLYVLSRRQSTLLLTTVPLN